MNKNDVRKKISDALIEGTEQSSLRSLRVTKLVAQLDINHNSFYYHFENKYDVALYVFRLDLAEALRELDPEGTLLEAPLNIGSDTTKLPYYLHHEIGAHALDMGDFYKALVHCAFKRPVFYRKLFNDEEPEFRARLLALYRPAVANDLDYVLDGRYLPQETFDFLVSMYLDHIYHIPAYHLAHESDSPALLDDAVNPFWNMFYEMLTVELQRYPINRRRGSDEKR